MKTKLFKLIFLFLIGTFTDISVKAYDFEEDGLYFTIISTGNLTCRLDSVDAYYKNRLIIPSEVSYNKKNLKITEVFTGCIASCVNLKEIVIPNNDIELKTKCFANCKSLEKVDLSAYDKNLPSGCFYDCSNLNQIQWPKKITELSSELFYRCKNLGDIELPEGIISIGDRCFSFAKFKSLSLPSSLVEIGERSFEWSGGDNDLILPDSLQIIGNQCFLGFAQNTLYVPSSVITLGTSVFAYSYIKNIIFDNNSPIRVFQGIKGFSAHPHGMFEDCDVEKIVLPPFLEEIGDYCFAGCDNLRDITFPSTLKRLGDSSLADLKLNQLSIPKNIEFINQDCFGSKGATTINKLIWEPKNLYEDKFKAIAESGIASDLRQSSFMLGIINECVITDNCDFLYLGWIDDHRKTYEYLLFKDSKVNKLTISDASNDLVIGCILNTYSSDVGGINGIKWTQGYLYKYYHYPSTVASFNMFRKNWMEDIKELYIGRKIVGNKLYCPNLRVLTIGNVDRVDIESDMQFIKRIESISVLPPSINNLTFTTEQYINLPVIVPDDAIEAYQNAEGWKNFWNIMTKTDFETLFPDIMFLNQSELSLNIGENFRLTATFQPGMDPGNIIQWDSSNMKVATVSNNGLVVGFSEGESIITASCGEYSATCKVTVLGADGVDNILMNSNSQLSIYSIDGVLIKKECPVEKLNQLPKGIYIIVSDNKRFKISL